MTAESSNTRSGHKAVHLANDGSPSIEGYRCGSCKAVLIAPVLACRSCGGRDQLVSFTATPMGKVFSWTVVHRSYPGIAVPFVSAIVDLDDGLTLKGTLRDIDPAEVEAGLRVRVVFDDAGGARDSEGTAFVGFHFLANGELN